LKEGIKTYCKPKLDFDSNPKGSFHCSNSDTHITIIAQTKNLKSRGLQISFQARAMLFENEDVQFLIQLRFTETQARLYLTLLKTGKTNAATLQKLTKIARPTVYVTLEELQEKGLVEKEIAMPNDFKATPIDFALQSLIQKRKEDFRRITDRTKEFLRKFQQEKEDTIQVQDYKFIILSGKERIVLKMKQQHDSARFSVDILSTLPRWLQIVDECFDNYKKALARGVKYRVIAETLSSEVRLSRDVTNLLAKPNFKLKLTPNARQTNSAVFDNKEATFNFFPSKFMAESPLIWTNHPSFLSMCQDQFEAAWRTARNCNERSS